MIKRAFRDHRLALVFVAINTLIVAEEFAHQHLHWGKYPGIGWYWTAVLSLPSSLALYLLRWPWSSEVCSLVALLFVGAFQWGIIGRFFDRQRRTRDRSAKNAQFLRSI